MTNTNDTNVLIPGSILPGESPAAWVARVYRSGWVPACCGTEVPFLYHGRRVLYCVDLLRGAHGYCDLDSDVIYDTLEEIRSR